MTQLAPSLPRSVRFGTGTLLRRKLHFCDQGIQVLFVHLVALPEANVLSVDHKASLELDITEHV